jgi:hypothetical protein
MANLTGVNPLVLDTAATLFKTPITVKKIVLIPNAAADACRFDVLNMGATPKSQGAGATCTVTLTTTITSTGAFTTGNVAVGDFIVIRNTSTGNNIGVFRVTARTNDNVIVCAGDLLTNEAAATYTFDIITPQKAIELLSQATSAKMEQVDFGPFGHEFRNLILASITSSNVVVYVYLK